PRSVGVLHMRSHVSSSGGARTTVSCGATHELSPEDKAENTMIARIRILVEHVIAAVKRCRIVHDVFRNTKAHFDDLVMEIACGLHNFRTTLRSHALE